MSNIIYENTSNSHAPYRQDGDTDSQHWVFRLVGSGGGGDDDKGPTTDDDDKGPDSGSRSHPYLDRRAVRIQSDSDVFKKSPALPDIDNVQGDVFMMFPKVRYNSFFAGNYLNPQAV